MLNVVGREQELDRLMSLLEQAIGGAGQVVLVSGDAGSGKSTLLKAFAELAEEAHDELLVVSGTCDPQTGPANPYLPFQEILEQLSGDEEALVAKGAVTPATGARLKRFGVAVGETLVDFAPDLIGVLVPGATLMAKLGKYVAGKSRWGDKLRKKLDSTSTEPPRSLDASQIFEQYSNVIKRLSEDAPLVLLIDDLQWADTASLGLLFRLARRLEEARVLLIGAFRPSDVALGRGGERHPLEQTIAELKRYRGDILVDLDAATAERGLEFVTALLAAESNHLGQEFAEALHRHTGGHPLFTVELLRALQERGELVRGADGAWIAPANLEWGALPSRAEGVIEERLGRLEGEAARSLTIASVEGERFTVEVLARVQPRDPRELVRELGETLQKRHRLVAADGLERVDGGRLSHYRFANNQVQAYLYRRLDEVEASYLHEDVGNALEALYGQRAPEAALQLARHFDLGGVPDKARLYLRYAADQAARSFANDVALEHFARALELEPGPKERFELLAGRVKVYELVTRRQELQADLDEMDRLAELLGSATARATVLLRRSSFEAKLGVNELAVQHAGAAAEAALEAGDQAAEADATLLLGRALTWTSRPDEARATLLRAAELATALGDGGRLGSCYTNLGIVSDLSGDRAAARDYFLEAQTTFLAADDLDGVSGALNNLAITWWRDGDLAEAERLTREGLELNRRVGNLDGQAKSLANLAMLLNDQGHHAESANLARESLELSRELGSTYNLTRTLGVLASALNAQGFHMGARTALLEGLEVDRAVNDRQDECFQFAGLAFTAMELRDYEEAEARLAEGLRLAREVGELSAERWLLNTKAALSLALRDTEACIASAEAARTLAVRLDSTVAAGAALLLIGRAKLAAGDPMGALGAYESARALLATEAPPDLAIGLASVYAALGDTVAALAALEPHLERLLSTSLDGVPDRFSSFADACAVLRMTADPRAERLLANARATRDLVAARVEDVEVRRTFLERLPAAGDRRG